MTHELRICLHVKKYYAKNSMRIDQLRPLVLIVFSRISSGSIIADLV
jgi:hypothetical protein